MIGSTKHQLLSTVQSHALWPGVLFSNSEDIGNHVPFKALCNYVG